MKKRILILVVTMSMLLSCFNTISPKADMSMFQYPIYASEPIIAAVSHDVFQYGKGNKITMYGLDIYSFFSLPQVYVLDSKGKTVKKLKVSDYILFKASWDGKGNNKKYVKDGTYQFKFVSEGGTDYYKFAVKKNIKKKDIKKSKTGRMNLPGFNSEFPSDWVLNFNMENGDLILRTPKKSGSGKRMAVKFSAYDFRTTGYTEDYIKSEYETILKKEDAPTGKFVKKGSGKIGSLKATTYQLESKATKANGYLASGESSFTATVQQSFVYKSGMAYIVSFAYKKGNKTFNKDIEAFKKGLKIFQVKDQYFEVLPFTSGNEVDFAHLKTTIPENMSCLLTSSSIYYFDGSPINHSNSFSVYLAMDDSGEGTIEKAADYTKIEMEEMEIMPGVVPAISDVQVSGMPGKLVVSKTYDESASTALEYGTYIFKAKDTLYSIDYSINLKGESFSKEAYESIGKKIEQIIGSISVY